MIAAVGHGGHLRAAAAGVDRLRCAATYGAIAAGRIGQRIGRDRKAGSNRQVSGHVRLLAGGGRHAVAPGDEVIPGVGYRRYLAAGTARDDRLRRGAADGTVGAGRIAQGVGRGTLRPVADQHIGIHRAETGSEVVPCSAGITCHSRYAVVAGSDVMVHRSAPLAELGGAELIKTNVGVSLPLTGLLHNQRHQSGKRGGGGRGAADTGQAALRLNEVAVVARRRKRDIGNAALVSGRDTGRRLPGWPGVGERDAAAGGPQPRAAGDVAALIPCRFRDVADGRGIPGSVTRVPVASGPVVELGPPDCHVVGGGGEAVHARNGSDRIAAAVAARGARVSRGDQGGDPLCCGLLPEVVVKTVLGGPHIGFAGSETGAHYRGQVVGDDVLSREVDPVRGGGTLGNDEVYGGVSCHRPRPLHVQVRLAVLPRPEIARIGAVEDHLYALTR